MNISSGRVDPAGENGDADLHLDREALHRRPLVRHQTGPRPADVPSWTRVRYGWSTDSAVPATILNVLTKPPMTCTSPRLAAVDVRQRVTLVFPHFSKAGYHQFSPRGHCRCEES